MLTSTSSSAVAVAEEIKDADIDTNVGGRNALLDFDNLAFELITSAKFHHRLRGIRAKARHLNA
jgi:hypothetical protein